ncbi:MAG: PEP-CTERM sorting domain-containing protein [Pontiellaceae bacterium]|nr:PEP-CTERM sorting domain-containing protein [Pontiellaceae bacterium]MBN2783193.1 PEP-CTERM sorting domain-containing protein [Pontiellaceae bacterium]
MKSTLLIAMSSLLIGLSASADISLKINAADDTFYFEGSDTGSPTEYVLDYQVGYRLGPSHVAYGDLILIDSAFAEVSGDYSASIATFTDNSGIFLAFNNPDVFSTLTADNTVHFSYAGWSEDRKATFEGGIGNSLTLVDGSGFSSIAIEAVPEPATIGLVGLLGGALIAVRRIFAI